jgi:hypothetical protein
MMKSDLVPVRHAHDMLRRGTQVDDVMDELRRVFRLDFVDAMAAVAACTALAASGFTFRDEPFARPYV